MKCRWAWLSLLLIGCDRTPPDHKVHITYWEKWSGAEAAAMQAVVDAFNRSQDRIVVEFLSTSSVDRKTLVATAGGDPPDVAGLWVPNIYSFADRDALMPLDDFIRAEGYTLDEWAARYAPVYADMVRYRGRFYGLPATPATTALHWNKRLFREAGLDPDRPPRTVTELDEFAERLTKRDPRTGAIVQLGFLPQEPGWFSWAFPQWFGAKYVDESGEIAIGHSPAARTAYEWVARYTRRYGLNEVRTFVAGFGGFASSQNPFMAGKVAMVLQGVWMDNFINQFAPGLEYGVAPWPAAQHGQENFTVADLDVLVIPRGAKHPREAWEFIKYVNSINPYAQRSEELQGMELLCYLQKKQSPLRQWSPFFERHHPHRYIALFRALGDSPNAIHYPKIGIWQEYRRELDSVFESVRLLARSPEEALAFCQQRVADSWRWHRRSLERRGALWTIGTPGEHP
ncbi:MAG: ABC transporter substrate-binding protein [Verrucomicrobiae bacterium]|nr:ABC transporter substrate-binding protein [Verrucomicrobiae bacterium]